MAHTETQISAASSLRVYLLLFWKPGPDCCVTVAAKCNGPLAGAVRNAWQALGLVDEVAEGALQGQGFGDEGGAGSIVRVYSPSK